MDAFTPAQTTELVSRIGAKKARMRIDKMFVNSFMGGPLLGFGCALLISTNSSLWFQTNAPGLIRSIGAAFFPVGLIMIILTGADLFTSYVLVCTSCPRSDEDVVESEGLGTDIMCGLVFHCCLFASTN